jgi:hypothetical protein
VALKANLTVRDVFDSAIQDLRCSWDSGPAGQNKAASFCEAPTIATCGGNN